MQALHPKFIRRVICAAVCLAATPLAMAHGSVSWSVTVGSPYGAPRYYAPPPPPPVYAYPSTGGGVVAINPQPVIINPPAGTVYVAPAPQRVIVPPGTVVYYGNPYGPPPGAVYGYPQPHRPLPHHYGHGHPRPYPNGARLNYGY